MGELLSLIIIQLLSPALAKHGKALTDLAPGPDVRAGDQMVMGVRHHLGGGGAIVLNDIPVLHASCSDQGFGEYPDGSTQFLGLTRRDIRQFGTVRPRADQQVAEAEGHDIQKGYQRRGG